MEMLLKEILAVAGGTLIQGDGNSIIRNISTDTRTIRKGDIYVALKGERFDGNDFIGEAIEKGASGIIASNKEAIQKIKEGSVNCWLLLTEDTLKTLGEIASLWLKRCSPQKVAVIAGSAGKTTTKEMIASVVANRPDMLVSQENFNNLIGVPLNLFRLEKAHRGVVQEIGMNEAGELRRLMQILKPNIAAIVNIGTAHIGKFGSEEALLQAKGEVLDELSEEALLIYNADCQMTRKLLTQKKLPRSVETFGINSKAKVSATEIEPILPCGYSFMLNIKGKKAPAEIRIFGRHNIYNVLCASAVLHNLGIAIDEIASRLKEFSPFKLRSEIEEIGGIYLVKDCYNSSPEAAINTIKALAEFSENLSHKQGKKWRSIAVLGDMLELGSLATEFHQQVGKICLDSGIDVVVAVGNSARIIARSITEKGGTVYYFHDLEETVEFLSDFVQPGDVLLFKASRLLKFERIIDGFKLSLTSRSSQVMV